MQYGIARTERRITATARQIRRTLTLTALAIAFSASRSEGQISYGFGSFTFTGGTACGTIGWGSPGPYAPSLGSYYPGSYVLVGGQLYYVSSPSYSSSDCSTSGSVPTGSISESSTSFVEGGGGGGGGEPGETTNGDPNDWTGDTPYGSTNLNTPTNELTVTPEPSTVILLGSGLLGLGVAVRRRRTKAQRPQDG